MPQKMDLAEIIDNLKETDPKEFSAALHKAAPDHYQAIYRVGFGTAKGQYESGGEGKLDAANAEIERLKAEHGTLEERIAKLQEESPDVGKLEAEYQQLLRQGKEKQLALEKQIAEREARHADELRSFKKESLFEKAESVLLGMGAKTPKIARLMLRDPDVRSRVEIGKDGPLIFDADGKTPLPIPDGHQPWDVLAASVAKMEDWQSPDFWEDRRQNGSGFRHDGQGGERIMKRADFDKAAPAKKMAFIKEGGQIVD